MKDSIIEITDKIKIYKDKIKYRSILSSGPGGQNINKVYSAVMLKYDMKIHNYHSRFLCKVKTNCGKKLSNDQVLTIKVNTHRSQYLNRKLALSKLIEIFKESTRYRKPRVHTYPSKKQRLMRLQRKKLNSLKKLSRKSPKTDD
tara:strand:- start:168 stop:599 length:432 start_codon:yes stop_codon:yes gene_type:complete